MSWKNKRYRNEADDESMEFPMNGVPMFLNLGGNNNDGPQMYGGSPIRVVENHIYFYGDIDEQNALSLNTALHEVDVKLQNTKNVLGDDYNPVVHLHMNTYGGGVFAAFSTVDMMKRLKSDVYTYVEGSVASAGTLICGSGKKRYIGEHAHLLIHQLSSGMYGKYDELQDEMGNLDKLMGMLKDFYKKKTKLPMKRLEEILKKDLWLSADEVIQYGIADEVG